MHVLYINDTFDDLYKSCCYAWAHKGFCVGTTIFFEMNKINKKTQNEYLEIFVQCKKKVCL